MGCVHKTNTIKIKSYDKKKEVKTISSSISQSNKIYESYKLNTTTFKSLSYTDTKYTNTHKIKKTQNFSVLSMTKIDYSKKLSSKTWTFVLDFLSFKELFEVGKVNYLFNSISKNENILKKFFKHRKNGHGSDNNSIIKKAVLVNILIYPHNNK